MLLRVPVCLVSSSDVTYTAHSRSRNRVRVTDSRASRHRPSVVHYVTCRHCELPNVSTLVWLSIRLPVALIILKRAVVCITCIMLNSLRAKRAKNADTVFLTVPWLARD
jgi:hypothetical protein